MKPIPGAIFVFFFSICFVKSYAQEELFPELNQNTFIKQIGIGQYGNSRGITVIETVDGFILTGYTSGKGNGGEDVFLIKTDFSGDTIWTKTFGGKHKDNGWAVRQTKEGGYIIVGFTDSFGAGGMDIYLIKTDSNGKALWTKTLGGPGDEYGWDIRTTYDGGFIIASQTNSTGEGEIDAQLIKIDSLGNKVWSKTYGGKKIDRVFSVQQSADGGYVAAGITYSYESIGPNDRDGYYMKTNSSGDLEWHKTFGGDLYDVGHSIALTQEGGVLVTGYGESLSSHGKRDVYLIKANIDGQELWVKSYGSNDSERGIKGYQTKDGGHIAIGFIEDIWDVYLVRTDSSGEELWYRTFGERNKREIGYTVRETKDGGFILIGHSENFDGTGAKILLIRTDGEGMVKKEE